MVSSLFLWVKDSLFSGLSSVGRVLAQFLFIKWRLKVAKTKDKRSDSVDYPYVWRKIK